MPGSYRWKTVHWGASLSTETSTGLSGRHVAHVRDNQVRRNHIASLRQKQGADSRADLCRYTCLTHRPHVKKLLEHARELRADQLDAPLDNPARVFPWDTPARSLRELLTRLVQTKEIWTAALTGGALPDLERERPEQGTPDALIARLEKADADFGRVLADVRNRNAWSDTFVDALCEPPETFSFGGMFAHVITFNAVGLGGALIVSRLLTSFLFGVGPSDPTTIAAVAGMMAAVALTACYIPARRAAKVDPLIALRSE